MTDVQEHDQRTDAAAQGERLGAAEGPVQPVSRRVTFTVASAARECQLHQKTIRRKLPQLAEHGATLEPDGWVIPYEALHAIGLHPGQQAPSAAAAEKRAQGAQAGPEVTSRANAQRPAGPDVQAQLDVQLDTLRLQAELAEARAAQRLAEELLTSERRSTAELVAALKLNIELLSRQLPQGSGADGHRAQERPTDPSEARTGGPQIATEPSAEVPAPEVPGKLGRFRRLIAALKGE